MVGGLGQRWIALEEKNEKEHSGEYWDRGASRGSLVVGEWIVGRGT